jgi:hypothetical protein
MVDATLPTACLLAALALLAALPAAADAPSGNADDGQAPSGDREPCEVVTVGPSPPYVDPHPECIVQA